MKENLQKIRSALHLHITDHSFSEKQNKKTKPEWEMDR